MWFRKSKESVIKAEKELANPPNLDAQTAKAVGESQRNYLNAAKFFEQNIAVELQKSAKNSKRLAAFFGFLTFMSIAALVGLTPLKQDIPYVVRVDNATGSVDIVRPGGEAKPTEIVDDEFELAVYVRARESYNFADNDGQFALVKLKSYPEMFTEYRNFQLSKKGYTEVLGKNQMLRTEINDINFLTRDEKKRTGTAQVWFTKTVLDRYGMPDLSMDPVKFQATISYDYKNLPKKREDQWLNSRGWGARSYSRTEVVGVKR